MQSNGSTDAVTPLGTPNLTQMDDGDAIRHEMAPRARGGGAPPWYGFKLLLASSQGLEQPRGQGARARDEQLPELKRIHATQTYPYWHVV